MYYITCKVQILQCFGDMKCTKDIQIKSNIRSYYCDDYKNHFNSSCKK